MPKYSFDTSCLINPYRRDFPMDVFPSFWDRLSERIAKGEVVASDAVRIELERKDDSLLEWALSQEPLFVPMDTKQQEHVSTIVKLVPNWPDPRSMKNDADPWVIALARAQDLAVVSGEKFNANGKVNVPAVCKKLGVRHLSLLEYVREAKLSFSTAF